MLSTHKRFRSAFVIMLVAFFTLNLFSQQKPKDKIIQTDDDKLKRQFVINQAIYSLKDNLLNAKSIDDVEQRAYVVAEASKTLWKSDQAFAKDILLTTVSNFISRYESVLQSLNKPGDAEQQLENLTSAIKILLRAIAKKDLKSAEIFQDKFFKVKEAEISGKRNLNDKLETAKEGEEFDIDQSTSLVGKIIEFGIPSSFPQYLFDLKAKNPALADKLYRQALFNLSAKPFYKPSDAIHLSSYAFNETISVLPALEGNETDGFGVYHNNIKISIKNSGTSFVTGYLSAYRSFVNSRLQTQAQGSFNTPNNLLQAYFLNKKVKAYSRLYNFRSPDVSESFEASLSQMAQVAGLNLKLLGDLTSYAERLASNNNPLGLDDGEKAFEKAEKSNDPREKLQYTIAGIVQLIDRRKFIEAESKISEIKINEIQDALILLLNTRAALAGIEQIDWEEFEKRTNKITDKQIKAYLFVKSLYALDSQKQRRDLFADYLLQAEKNLEAVEDKMSKAKGFITLSALILASDKTKGQLLLFDALKAINNVPGFWEDAFELRVPIPGGSTFFADYLYKDAFEKSFMLLAKNDWLDSQVQTIQIKSPGLKAIAQVATAKSVLQ